MGFGSEELDLWLCYRDGGWDPHLRARGLWKEREGDNYYSLPLAPDNTSRLGFRKMWTIDGHKAYFLIGLPQPAVFSKFKFVQHGLPFSVEYYEVNENRSAGQPAFEKINSYEMAVSDFHEV